MKARTCSAGVIAAFYALLACANAERVRAAGAEALAPAAADEGT